MPAEVPGLDFLLAYARSIGIDVTDTVAMARKLMQPDPAAMLEAGERLSGVARGLSDRYQDLDLAGANVLDGWRGAAADAFGPHQAELLDQVAGSGRTSHTLATNLREIAPVYEQSQRTVLTATGATVTALRMAQGAYML